MCDNDRHPSWHCRSTGTCSSEYLTAEKFVHGRALRKLPGAKSAAPQTDVEALRAAGVSEREIAEAIIAESKPAARKLPNISGVETVGSGR